MVVAVEEARSSVTKSFTLHQLLRSICKSFSVTFVSYNGKGGWREWELSTDTVVLIPATRTDVSWGQLLEYIYEWWG